MKARVVIPFIARLMVLGVAVADPPSRPAALRGGCPSCTGATTLAEIDPSPRPSGAGLTPGQVHMPSSCSWGITGESIVHVQGYGEVFGEPLAVTSSGEYLFLFGRSFLSVGPAGAESHDDVDAHSWAGLKFSRDGLVVPIPPVPELDPSRIGQALLLPRPNGSIVLLATEPEIGSGTGPPMVAHLWMVVYDGVKWSLPVSLPVDAQVGSLFSHDSVAFTSVDGNLTWVLRSNEPEGGLIPASIVILQEVAGQWITEWVEIGMYVPLAHAQIPGREDLLFLATTLWTGERFEDFISIVSRPDTGPWRMSRWISREVQATASVPRIWAVGDRNAVEVFWLERGRSEGPTHDLYHARFKRSDDEAVSQHLVREEVSPRTVFVATPRNGPVGISPGFVDARQFGEEAYGLHYWLRDGEGFTTAGPFYARTLSRRPLAFAGWDDKVLMFGIRQPERPRILVMTVECIKR